MSSKKGSQFEREIPVALSKWWTNGEREDVFWRRDSGARAKRRSREGKHTFGAHGDICAIDPIGLPLTNIMTLELKRGYGQWSLMDVIDRPPMRKGQKNRTLQKFEEFLEQVVEDSQAVNTYPVLITKRDKRQELIILPHTLLVKMKRYHFLKPPSLTVSIEGCEQSSYKFTALHFYSFLEWCNPSFFKQMDGENELRSKKETQEESQSQ